MLETVDTILQNSLFSLLADLSIRVVGMILFILISRRMGIVESGIYSLALTFLGLFTELTFWGLDQLLTREVAQREELASKYVSHFLLVRLFLASSSVAVLYLVVSKFLNYAPHQVNVIMLMGISVIAESVSNIGQAVFIAFREMKYVTTTTIFASLLKLIIGAFALYRGASLEIIVGIITTANFLKMSLMITIVFRRFAPSTPRIDWEFVRRQTRIVLPFILIAFCYTTEFRIDTVLVSVLRPEEDVGVYGAAITIFYAFFLFSKAYKDAIFPIMSRLYASDSVALEKLYATSLRYLFIVIIPTVMIVSATATELVHLLYRRAEFADTAMVLSVLIWSLVFVFLAVPNNRLIIVANGQRQVTLFLIASLLINLIMNMVLIPIVGPIGAAIARISSTGLTFLLGLLFVHRRLYQLNYWHVFGRASVAALLMLVLLFTIRSYGMLISLSISVIVYISTLWISKAINAQDIVLFKQLLKSYRQRILQVV